MVALWLVHRAGDMKPEIIRRYLLLYVMHLSAGAPDTFNGGKITEKELLWRSQRMRIYKKTGHKKQYASDLRWLTRKTYIYNKDGFWHITKAGIQELERIEKTLDHREYAFSKLLSLSSVELELKANQSLHNLFNNLLRLFR